MRALTVEEVGCVSGGGDYWSDPLFGDGGPLVACSPSIVLGGTSGYAPITDGSIFSTGGVSAFESFGGGGAQEWAKCTVKGLWSLNTLIAMGTNAAAAFTAYCKFLDKVTPPHLKAGAIITALAVGAGIGLGKEAITSGVNCLTPPMPGTV
jgi:hypothetical protein